MKKYKICSKCHLQFEYPVPNIRKYFENCKLWQYSSVFKLSMKFQRCCVRNQRLGVLFDLHSSSDFKMSLQYLSQSQALFLIKVIESKTHKKKWLYKDTFYSPSWIWYLKLLSKGLLDQIKDLEILKTNNHLSCAKVKIPDTRKRLYFCIIWKCKNLIKTWVCFLLSQCKLVCQSW